MRRRAIFLKPIRSDEDLTRALELIEQLWDSEPGSEDADDLEVLSILVENYEEAHYPIGPPDPIEAIKFRMEQGGLTTKDLEALLGQRSRVSEILNRRRGLSLKMMRELHEKWGIPAHVLLAGEGGGAKSHSL